MAAYDSLQVGDTITVSGLSAQWGEINGTYTVYGANPSYSNNTTNFVNLSAFINGRDIRALLYVVDNGPNTMENWPQVPGEYSGDNINFYPQLPPDSLDYLQLHNVDGTYKWYYWDDEAEVPADVFINLPNWQINWGGGTWGPGGGGSSQNTFGLPADVVALITSRFGTVANFLRLRNQGQV